MELTITETGALYALQHGASKDDPDGQKKWLGADRIQALPALATSEVKFTVRSVSAKKPRSAPQNTVEQVTDGFPEYRVAA